MKKVFLIFITLLMTSLLISCGKEVEKVTLSIYVEDEYREQIEVEKGSRINFELNDDYYLFLGWTDESGEIDYTNYQVINDMNIYAKTIEVGSRYEIIYHLNNDANFDGISYPKCYRVGEVTKLVKPNRPYKYEFTGWYFNGELITEITDKMYGDIELYDSWVDNNTYIHLNYVDEGASFYSFEPTKTLIEGQNYDLPYPIREGYYFNGWYLDANFTKRVYKIDESFHSDVTLYAKYSKKTKANTYVSFVGDSISTYHGLIPSDAGAYYPTYVNFPAENTYFLLTCSGMGFNFLKNDSYAGSRLSTQVVQGDLIIPPAISDKRIAGLTDGVHDPDILILHIGNNDYSQGINKETFRNAISQYVIKVRKLYDDVEIYFCLHPANGYASNFQILREAFNEIIIEESKEEKSNYKTIDLRMAWDETNFRNYIFANSHPNELGFKSMSEVIIDELKKTHNYE